MKLIDRSNHYSGSSYEPVAGEYYNEQLHPTCHNFNLLSRIYLDRQISGSLLDKFILEVGAGDSSVAAILHARGYKLNQLEIADASPKMLKYSEKWKEFGATLRVADAHSINRLSSSVSILVASLGDPYNTPDFWTEAWRLLHPKGQLIFTLPSFEWAARFRQQNDLNSFHSAEFQLGNGSIINIPSFIWPLDLQVEMIEKTGFMVTHFEALGLQDLDANSQSPKINVFGGNVSSVIWGFTAYKQECPISIPTRQQWKESLFSLSQQ